MDIRPSLLSFIFADSSKWRINYAFPELVLELDTRTVNLNPEQVLETHIQKGWIWSSLTLETLDQNFQFKGEPYRVCRRVNILRDYPDDKIKIYP